MDLEVALVLNSRDVEECLITRSIASVTRERDELKRHLGNIFEASIGDDKFEIQEAIDKARQQLDERGDDW